MTDFIDDFSMLQIGALVGAFVLAAPAVLDLIKKIPMPRFPSGLVPEKEPEEPDPEECFINFISYLILIRQTIWEDQEALKSFDEKIVPLVVRYLSEK